MPSVKKQKILRATDEQLAGWEAAAEDCGYSFNQWAAAALDQAANQAVAPESFRAKVETKMRNQQVARESEKESKTDRKKGGCPAFHTKGVRCKLCGETGK